MQIQEGYIDYKGYKTWYVVFGDLRGGVTPLLGLHGGPGYPHNSLKNLSELSHSGRPVVLYDQLGCGNSDRPDDPGLWTVKLFLEEIDAVRSALGLTEIDMLGHSWGGSLAIEYALKRPSGLRKLILHSPLLDSQLWIREAERLKDTLPVEVAETMRRHEKAGTTDEQEYKDAYEVFKENFVVRLKPMPQDLIDADNASSQQVYETMWGPNEAFATGTLKDWSCLDRLSQIDKPTLLISGRFDEATPAQIELAHNAIPGSEWVILENSAHCGNVEEPEKYLRAVTNFLG
jgi:proline-specific peptidase